MNVDLKMRNYERFFSLRDTNRRLIKFICFLLWMNRIDAQPVTIIEDKKKEINEYHQLDRWAAHPDKKDFSDSICKSIKNEKIEIGADVFFIHPTTYTKKKFENWNASLTDREINEKTDKSTILYQASVFNGSCRIFAPRYRQVNIKAFYIERNKTEQYFDTAYNDIKNAFIYYLENYNHGRPIIIASHSQGTIHAARLLKEFFENKELIKQLVCAYIIGMPIPENYFSTLPVCKDSTQTGCFVGWRTFKKNYEPTFVKKEKFKSIVVNPLSWEIDNKKISNEKNVGGILFNYDKIIPKVVNAEIHNNILWTSKPNIFGKIFIRKKNYHIGDINLFYLNIRENVKCRIKKFYSNN